MENSFEIFVDSAANLSEELIKETGIEVVSFTYTLGGEEHLCFEKDKPFKEIAKNYYASMAAGAEMKTSLIGEAAFEEALTPALEKGKDIILITMTSGMSGTHAQAVKAQKSLSEKFPERKIYVIDSANASMGEGLLAVYAARLRDCGEDVEACAKWVEDNKYGMNSYVTVNDLKYLKRSGRVSTIIAIAGALLNIKPMLRADGSSPAMLTVYSKERGRKRSIDAIIKGFTDNVTDPENQTIAIAHADCEEEALQLAERLKELGAKDIVIEYYDLCTGSHVGPGTLALFFLGKDRREEKAQATEPRRFVRLLRRKAQ